MPKKSTLTPTLSHQGRGGFGRIPLEERPLDDSFAQRAQSLIDNIADTVVAPEEVIRLCVICLMAEGHLLLDDLPGVGKTLLARTIAQSIGAVFKRLQFTPDLLPTDITGASIYDRAQGGFRFVPGPIFANIVLADEINRAGTRTQSALLEAMGEGQVTADGQSHPLPKPFCVVATQNDVDPYGTFPLPHAQLDRFLMLLSIGYPGEDEASSCLDGHDGSLQRQGPLGAADRCVMD